MKPKNLLTGAGHRTWTFYLEPQDHDTSKQFGFVDDLGSSKVNY
jgi:hypothetical protein